MQQEQFHSSAGSRNLPIPAGRAPCSQACEFPTLHPHSSGLLKSALCLLGLCVKEAKGSAARQLIIWPTSTFDLGENSQDNTEEEKARDSAREMAPEAGRGAGGEETARDTRGKGKVETGKERW